MKQWIREHPWRLEIVPGLIILFAITYPALFYKEVPAVNAETWFKSYIYTLLMVIIFAAYGSVHNHLGAIGERRKRFNVWSPLSVLWMSFWGWITAKDGLWDIEISYFNDLSVIEHTQFYIQAWSVIMAVGWLIQAVVEWTRPYRPRAQSVESIAGVSDVQPKELFYYREVCYNWFLLIPMITAAIASVVMAITIDAWFSICAFVAIAASVLNARAVFVISKERVSAWVALRKVSIPTKNISRCSVYWYDPIGHRLSFNYEGMRVFGTTGKAGPSLKIETDAGYEFLFVMENVETACKLINIAIVGRAED